MLSCRLGRLPLLRTGRVWGGVCKYYLMKKEPILFSWEVPPSDQLLHSVRTQREDLEAGLYLSMLGSFPIRCFVFDVICKLEQLTAAEKLAGLVSSFHSSAGEKQRQVHSRRLPPTTLIKLTSTQDLVGADLPKSRAAIYHNGKR